ncbi:HAD family hydrolase [Massilia glaciei]|uniref:HAD family hydrolase n=1 Tax=Massilia glaciei TaxID=1524097 RepID=A0A2U2HMS0_9BURK|nr:HAD family hydrolase [Massilia glaciei]PWF48821.1 HAD family hydrolase [Massilia glaciei]
MTPPPAYARPKAILFDLDDTLWPIGPVIARAEQSLHDWLGLHAPRVARAFSIDALRQARLAMLAREPGYGLDLGALRRAGLHAAFAEAGEDGAKVEHAMSHFFAARNAVALYEDVLPALRAMGRRHLLGSVTNGNADLHAIGLAHHFGVSVAASEFGRAKPDPAIFHAACAGLGVTPAEAVYVGDDLLLDVQGAQRAGLRAVWLNRNGGAAHPGHGVLPDAICGDFHQLLAWLELDGAGVRKP